MARFALSVLAVAAFLPTVCQAQLFPRLFGGKPTQQVGSACPGGVCPTSAQTQRTNYPAVSIAAAPIRAMQNRAGHWSFPGDIDSHLEGTHGVSTAGMTRQQKLELHDSLHEGRAPQQAQRGYGSLGSITAYRSTATRLSGFGSAGGQLRGYGSAGGLSVGSIDHDGLVITSVSAPVTVATFAPAIQAALAPIVNENFTPVPIVEAALEVRAGREFKQTLRAAISQARRENKISVRDAFELQRASFSPAFIASAERLAVIQMVASGENPERIPRTEDGRVDTAGINWAELLKFLQVFLPILLELLKGLGL